MSLLQSLKEYAVSETASLNVTSFIVGRDYCCIGNSQGKYGISMHYFEPALLSDNHKFKKDLPLRFSSDVSEPQKPWPAEYVHFLSESLTSEWKGKSLSELIMFTGSDDPLLSAGGTAAVNSFFNNRSLPEASSLDFLDKLNLKGNETLGLIGHFNPIADKLKSKVKKMLIFELKSGENYIPPEKQPELLPLCDVVVCTGTTVPNGTLDEIVRYASGVSEFVLIGHTVPFIPEFFAETPITMLASSVVFDSDGLKNTLLSGKGGKSLKPFLKKILISGI